MHFSYALPEIRHGFICNGKMTSMIHPGHKDLNAEINDKK